jgi:hypothetical protein
VAICRDILASGHEIGNHSFTHGPDYASGTVTQKSSEIERCHHLIANTLGFQPRAFRGPGFVIDRDHLITLKKLNYLYDSSVLPCPYASLIMSIALPIMAGTRSFIKYGQARHGFAPLHAYHLDTDRITTVDPKSKIIELPAAVHPLWRSPLHATYLFSAGKRYFDAGASALRKRDLPYFLVLHGSDLFDEANEPRLKSFSTFRISVHKRLDMLKFVLHRLCVDFELIRGDRLAESMI